jgi:NAD(P)-dependent dehydrogenase (short-subunit alcohol dehydrogenase family)
MQEFLHLVRVRVLGSIVISLIYRGFSLPKMAQALRPDIAPSYVLRPLVKHLIDRGARDPNPITDGTLMKCVLDPSDVVKTTLFLVSSAARYVTRTVLPVDGGWLSDGGWSAY